MEWMLIHRLLISYIAANERWTHAKSEALTFKILIKLVGNSVIYPKIDTLDSI